LKKSIRCTLKRDRELQKFFLDNVNPNVPNFILDSSESPVFQDAMKARLRWHNPLALSLKASVFYQYGCFCPVVFPQTRFV